jgi:hypothetical protein
MPRHRTLSGRSKRQRRRDMYSLTHNNRPNANLNSVHSIQNGEIILRDTFKCALNVIPRTFNSFDCGLMDLQCRFCNAKHFESEVTLGERTAFTSCCHKGKAILPALSQNEYFKSLYDGLTSNEPSIKRKSKNYFENIRKYNSSFAMISSEAKISDTVTKGVYHFKIHDVFNHRSDPMTAGYGRSPCYAQLYFYDVDTAVNCRLREHFNQTCNNNIRREMSLELERINPFVRSFIAMKEHCQRVENQNKEICMLVKVNRDLRRYNDTVQTDVAVIFSTMDGEPPFERNMISFSKVH